MDAAERESRFFPYLEGIRGAAALYVAAFHAFTKLHRGSMEGIVPFGGGAVLLFGHYAVGIFIVLSGYVLTVPVATSGRLKGGVTGFLKRRAWRILPPYYAALILATPLWLFHVHYDHIPKSGNVVIQFVTHLLLIHDFSDRTIGTICGSFWSVAVEFQIYIVFAILLLPTFKKFGLGAMTLVAFAIGMIPTIVGSRHGLAHEYALGSACFWYLGLFALGSSAALISLNRTNAFAALRARVPWTAISAVAACCFLLAALPTIHESRSLLYGQDTLLGVAFSSLLVVLASPTAPYPFVFLRSIFSSKPLVALGAFSYSLYLVQDFSIVTLGDLLSRTPLRDSELLLVMYVFGLPLTVAFAYVFSLCFERPFMSRSRRRADELILASEGGTLSSAVTP